MFCILPNNADPCVEIDIYDIKNVSCTGHHRDTLKVHTLPLNRYTCMKHYVTALFPNTDTLINKKLEFSQHPITNSCTTDLK